jgi:hypothetical protein
VHSEFRTIEHRYSTRIQITVPNHQASLFSNHIYNVSSPSKSQELCALRVLPGFWAQYTCKGWRDVCELQSQLISTPFLTKSIAAEKFTNTICFIGMPTRSTKGKHRKWTSLGPSDGNGVGEPFGQQIGGKT